jgi:hypothetical protein
MTEPSQNANDLPVPFRFLCFAIKTPCSTMATLMLNSSSSSSVVAALEAKRNAFKHRLASQHFGRVASIQDFKRLKRDMHNATKEMPRRSVQFCSDYDEMHNPIWSYEDVKTLWWSEEEEIAARRSIVESAQALRRAPQETGREDSSSRGIEDSSSRGLEHILDPAFRGQKMCRGREDRRAIISAAQRKGESEAAALSMKLSAADVSSARSAAILDVAAAMDVHFAWHSTRKEHLGETKPSGEPNTIKQYSLFSLRRKPRGPGMELV